MSLPTSKYFRPEEMKCRDGTPYPEQWALRLAVLFEALDVIREAYAASLPPEDLEQFAGLIVVSGYRTPEHNDDIGGAAKSQHPQGRAVDIRPKFRHRATTVGDINRLSAVIEQLLAAARLPAVGGVGVYPFTRDRKTRALFPGWVHVDTRPRPADGHIARWEGESFGAEKPSEVA